MIDKIATVLRGKVLYKYFCECCSKTFEVTNEEKE